MTQQPTPAPDDGTPTHDPNAALHWAAIAIGLAEARGRQGHPLTDTERVEYDRYQNAARTHGYTDEQIRTYLDIITQPTPLVAHVTGIYISDEEDGVADMQAVLNQLDDAQ